MTHNAFNIVVLGVAVAASVGGKGVLGGLLTGVVGKIIAFLLSMLPAFGTVVDETTMANIIKTVYSKDRIKDLTLEKCKLAAWLKSDTNFSGDALVVPIHYGNPSGGSHSYAKSKTNRSTSKYEKFVLDVIDDFDALRFDYKTILRMRNDPGAFLRAKEPEIDNMLKAAGRRMGIELYGNGSGKRGRLKTVANGQVLHSKTIKLDSIADATNFENGDVLKFAVDNPAYGTVATGIKAGTPVTIEDIDYDSGVLTVDEFLDTACVTVAGNDYIYIEGDYAAAAVGLQAWLPTTAPTAGDSFFGVDRSVNPTRLAGIRYDGTGDTSLQSTVIKFANKVFRLNGQEALDAMFCPTSFFTALEEEIGIAKTSYYDPDDEAVANIGFAAMRINYAGGSVPLVPDMDCPADRLFLPKRETFTKHSMGEAPSIFDADGSTLLRAGDATDGPALDLETYAYWNLGCNAPGLSGVATITAQSDYF